MSIFDHILEEFRRIPERLEQLEEKVREDDDDDEV